MGMCFCFNPSCGAEKLLPSSWPHTSCSGLGRQCLCVTVGILGTFPRICKCCPGLVVGHWVIACPVVCTEKWEEEIEILMARTELASRNTTPLIGSLAITSPLPLLPFPSQSSGGGLIRLEKSGREPTKQPEWQLRLPASDRGWSLTHMLGAPWLRRQLSLHGWAIPTTQFHLFVPLKMILFTWWKWLVMLICVCTENNQLNKKDISRKYFRFLSGLSGLFHIEWAANNYVICYTQEAFSTQCLKTLPSNIIQS